MASQLMPLQIQTFFDHASSLVVFELQANISSSLCITLLPVTLLLMSLVSFCRSSTQKKRSLRRSESHETLLFVFTPTNVAWPSNYANLLDSLVCYKSKTIQILVSQLVCSIRAGTIELRNPEDLTDLFRGRHRVHGWRMPLVLDFSSRITVLKWVLTSQLPSFRSKKDRNIKFYKQTTLLPSNFSLPAVIDEAIILDLRHFRSTSVSQGDTNPTLYLDFVAYPDLESTIRNFQSRLKHAISASLEFTTISSNISLLSDDFVLCSLPFKPRKYLNNKAAQRTSTPLLTSLHYVMDCLRSGTSTTTIESITNVTNEQITALRAIRKRLINDRALRSALIERWGEKGWREHVFLVDWEAGLLAAGFLTRWSVVVRKRAP